MTAGDKPKAPKVRYGRTIMSAAPLIRVIGKLALREAMTHIIEAVGNSADALAEQPGATIEVVLQSGGYLVIDNGPGMPPEPVTGDEPLLEAYIAQRTTSAEQLAQEELVDVWQTSPFTQQSLWWLGTFPGLSPKTRTERPQKGTLAIGARSFLSVGGKCVYWSLAGEKFMGYFGGKAGFSKRQAWCLEFPTDQQLEVGDDRHKLFPIETPLVNAKREPLKQGTVVRVSQLRAGVEEQLTPENVQRELAETFSADLREKRYRLFVIDQRNETVLRTGFTDGLRTEVFAPPYEGVYLGKWEMRIPGDTFQMELWWDLSARPNGVRWVWQGETKSPVTQLPHLQGTTLGTELHGYITWPSHITERQAAWSSDKSKPLPSAIRDKVEQAILAVLPEVDRKKRAHKERVQSARVVDVCRDMSNIVMNTINTKTKVLRSMMKFAPTHVPEGRKKKGQKKVIVNDVVTATTYDVNMDGVAGVVFRLVDRKTGQQVGEDRVTSRSGMVTFGHVSYDPGKEAHPFTIELILPDEWMADVFPQGWTEIDRDRIISRQKRKLGFGLSDVQPGRSHAFHLQIGTPKVGPKEVDVLQDLRIDPQPLTDPSRRYVPDGLLQYRVLTINTLATAFLSVIATGSPEDERNYLAECVQYALVEAALKERPELMEHARFLELWEESQAVHDDIIETLPLLESQRAKTL